jgi:hypothetical protein
VAETLVLFQEKQSVNNEKWAKDKRGDFLPRCFNKSPWVSSNNKTFHKANSLLSKACPQIKWASFLLKDFHHSKACLRIRWVNFHPKDFRRNKVCLRIRWVNSLLKTNSQLTL